MGKILFYSLNLDNIFLHFKRLSGLLLLKLKSWNLNARAQAWYIVEIGFVICFHFEIT